MSMHPTTDTTEAVAPTSAYSFSSLVLTEEFNVTLTGTRYGDDASDEFTITRHRKPHPDLLKALRRLTLHMCLLTENLTDAQLYPAPEHSLMPAAVSSRLQLREAVESGEAYVHPALENFRCTSVLWKPKGVVLKGGKRARYRSLGHSLKVETPTVDIRLSYSDEEEEAELEEWEYPFFNQMSNALEELRAELIAFMNGKYGEGGEQLSLFGKDPEPVEHPLQELVDSLAGVGSITISDKSGREVTLEKGRAPRSIHGQTIDDDE